MNPQKSTNAHLIANHMLFLPSMFVRHSLRLPSTISPRTQTCDPIKEKQWDTAHSASPEDGVSAAGGRLRTPQRFAHNSLNPHGLIHSEDDAIGKNPSSISVFQGIQGGLPIVAG